MQIRYFLCGNSCFSNFNIRLKVSSICSSSWILIFLPFWNPLSNSLCDNLRIIRTKYRSLQICLLCRWRIYGTATAATASFLSVNCEEQYSINWSIQLYPIPSENCSFCLHKTSAGKYGSFGVSKAFFRTYFSFP